MPAEPSLMIRAQFAASNFPDQFWLPDASVLAQIRSGQLIKIRVVNTSDNNRADFWDSVVIWITTEKLEGDHVHGTVDDSPLDRAGFREGDSITVPVDRVFDILPVGPSGQPGLNEARCRFALGKRALIGVTEIGPKKWLRRHGSVRRQQLVGTVSSVDPVRGLGFDLTTGHTFHLPPDGRALEEARPGSYRLRSTGDTIEDPVYLCTWTVERKADSPGILPRGFEV